MDQPVRSYRTAHRRGHRAPGRRTGAGDAGRLHAYAGRAAGRAVAGDRATPGRARAAVQGVLCRQRIGRRGGGAEDGLSLLPQSRRPPADAVHRTGEWLPRRNHRRAIGWRYSAVPARVCAAVAGGDVHALARCLPGRTGAKRRRPCAAGSRCVAGTVRTLARRNLCTDPGAARAMRGRDAHVPPGVSAPRARIMRCPWCILDRRRDRHRLRPYRHPVCLRTGRRDARPVVPVEGTDRRLPAAVGGVGHAAVVRRVPGRFARACVSAFAQLHRQPAGMCRGAGDLEDLRRRRRDCA